MRPAILSYTPADDDTDGFANDATATSGNPIPLTATSVGDGLGHHVIITPSGSVTGNYILTWTGVRGQAITETLATNTTNAVTSTNFFLTLTQVLAPSGIGSETVDIGWTDDAVSPPYPVDWASQAPANIYVDISGTIDFTIQETFANVLAGVTPVWNSITALTGKTADTYGQSAVGATAFQLLVNSSTSGATVHIYTDQAARGW